MGCGPCICRVSLPSRTSGEPHANDVAGRALRRGDDRERARGDQGGARHLPGWRDHDDGLCRLRRRRPGKRPGIVLVHEWWGITPHVRNQAQMIAQQGYTAFIADMYGDAKTADNPKDAGALSSSVMKDPKIMEARFSAARTQL